MIRAHEIILFFRFQNQAAGAMRRFSADMQAMNRTALAAQRRREFKTKETALDLRAADLLRKNRDIRAGMDARSISIAKQRLSVSRSIAGAEAGLLRKQSAINTAAARELAIRSRIAEIERNIVLQRTQKGIQSRIVGNRAAMQDRTFNWQKTWAMQDLALRGVRWGDFKKPLEASGEFEAIGGVSNENLNKILMTEDGVRSLDRAVQNYNNSIRNAEKVQSQYSEELGKTTGKTLVAEEAYRRTGRELALAQSQLIPKGRRGAPESRRRLEAATAAHAASEADLVDLTNKRTIATQRLAEAEDVLASRPREITTEEVSKRLRDYERASLIVGNTAEKWAILKAQQKRAALAVKAYDDKITLLNDKLVLEGARLDSIKLDMQALNRQYEQGEISIQEYRTQLKKLDADEAAHRQSLKKNQLAMAENRRQRSLLLAQSQAELAQNALMSFDPKVQRANQIIHGSRLAQMYGLVTLAATGFAAEQAMQLEHGATLAATQARAVGAPIAQTKIISDALQKGILKQMQEFPATAEQMNKSLYEIFSSMDFSGVRTEAQRTALGLGLMSKANKLAVATGTDLETTTSALITVLNDFGSNSGDIDKTLNTMVATIRYGRMNMSQFNQMLNKVAPAAAAANMSLEDVGSAMALVTRKQPSQRQASTGIGRLIELFSRKEFTKGLEDVLGVDVYTPTNKMRPLLDMLTDIANKFPELTRGGKSLQAFIQDVSALGQAQQHLEMTGDLKVFKGLLSTAEARRALVFLITNLKELRMIQNDIVKNNDEFVKSYEAMKDTDEVKWQIFKNQLRILVLTIGKEAIPMIMMLFSWLGRLVNYINSDAGKSFVGAVAKVLALASSLGVLFGTVGLVVGGLMKMYWVFKINQWMKYQAAIQGTTTAMTGLGAAAVKTAGLIGLVVSAIMLMNQIKRDFDWKDFTVGGADVKHRALPMETFNLFGDAKLYPGGPSLDEATTWIAGKAGLGPKKQEAYIVRGIKLAERFAAKRKILSTEIEANGKKERWYIINNTKAFEKWVAKRKAAEAFDPDALTAKAYKTFLKQQKAILLGEGDIAQVQQNQLAAQDKINEAKENALKLLNRQFELEDAIADAASQTQDITNQAVDAMMAKYNDLFEANKQRFGELFEGPWLTSPDAQKWMEWGFTPNMADLQKDLNESIARFRKFNKSISKLRKQGAPEELVTQLVSKGPEAQANIDLIIGAKPAERKKYFNAFNKAQADIKKATEKDFQREVDKWKKLPWEVVAGMESEQTLLRKRLTTLFENMFPNIGKIIRDKTVADLKKEWAKQDERDAATKKVEDAATKVAEKVTTVRGRADDKKDSGVMAWAIKAAKAAKAAKDAENKAFNQLPPGASAVEEIRQDAPLRVIESKYSNAIKWAAAAAKSAAQVHKAVSTKSTTVTQTVNRVVNIKNIVKKGKPVQIPPVKPPAPQTVKRVVKVTNVVKNVLPRGASRVEEIRQDAPLRAKKKTGQPVVVIKARLDASSITKYAKEMAKAQKNVNTILSRDLANMSRLWYGVGQKSADQLIMGFESKETYLQRRLNALFSRMAIKIGNVLLEKAVVQARQQLAKDIAAAQRSDENTKNTTRTVRAEAATRVTNNNQKYNTQYEVHIHTGDPATSRAAINQFERWFFKYGNGNTSGPPSKLKT